MNKHLCCTTMKSNEDKNNKTWSSKAKLHLQHWLRSYSKTGRDEFLNEGSPNKSKLSSTQRPWAHYKRLYVSSVMPSLHLLPPYVHIHTHTRVCVCTHKHTLSLLPLTRSINRLLWLCGRGWRPRPRISSVTNAFSGEGVNMSFTVRGTLTVRSARLHSPSKDSSSAISCL